MLWIIQGLAFLRSKFLWNLFWVNGTLPHISNRQFQKVLKQCVFLNVSRLYLQIKVDYFENTFGISHIFRILIKIGATYMRYFKKRKFMRDQGHKRVFGLIWLVVFKLEVGYQLLNLNELSEEPRTTIIFGNL